MPAALEIDFAHADKALCFEDHIASLPGELQGLLVVAGRAIVATLDELDVAKVRQRAGLIHEATRLLVQAQGLPVAARRLLVAALPDRDIAEGAQSTSRTGAVARPLIEDQRSSQVPFGFGVAAEPPLGGGEAGKGLRLGGRVAPLPGVMVGVPVAGSDLVKEAAVVQIGEHGRDEALRLTWPAWHHARGDCHEDVTVRVQPRLGRLPLADRRGARGGARDSRAGLMFGREQRVHGRDRRLEIVVEQAGQGAPPNRFGVLLAGEFRRVRTQQVVHAEPVRPHRLDQMRPG